MLSNGYRNIQLFRFSTLTREVYIFADEEYTYHSSISTCSQPCSSDIAYRVNRVKHSDADRVTIIPEPLVYQGFYLAPIDLIIVK